MSQTRNRARHPAATKSNDYVNVYSSCGYPVQLLGRTGTKVNRKPWYGTSLAWRCAIEADVERYWGPYRVIEDTSDGYPAGFDSPRLTFAIYLEVFGRAAPVPVQVDFWQHPRYELFGQQPQDYPRVYSEIGAPSAHRMPDDDALCLWYPHDPPERRWTHYNGLGRLLEIVQDHLFYEQYWRKTGGPNGGIWLGDQADHGINQRDEMWTAA